MLKVTLKPVTLEKGKMDFLEKVSEYEGPKRTKMKTRLLPLLLRHFDYPEDKDAEEKLYIAFYGYLSEWICDQFGDEYITWLWKYNKLAWVYEKVMTRFSVDMLDSPEAERFTRNLAVNLRDTFAKNMLIVKKSHPEINADPEIDYLPGTLTPFEDSEVKHVMEFQRYASIIKRLAPKYQTALFLIQLFPDYGLPDDPDICSTIEEITGSGYEELRVFLESEMDRTTRPDAPVVYPIRVASLAAFIGEKPDTVSQWLRRGKLQLWELLNEPEEKPNDEE